MSEKNNLIRRKDNVIANYRLNSPDDKILSEFNIVNVTGRIETNLEYCHGIQYEDCYQTTISITRLSEQVDLIPLVIPCMLVIQDQKESLKGKYVGVSGQFRSRNEVGEDGRKHLILFLFVTSIVIYKNTSQFQGKADINLIYLDGYLCKPPIYRKTFLGREVCDLFIAVNRPCGESDYIPCITWNRTARCSSSFNVGDHIKVHGSIQSRIYQKKLSPDVTEPRTAYEISIFHIQNDGNL